MAEQSAWVPSSPEDEAFLEQLRAQKPLTGYHPDTGKPLFQNIITAESPRALADKPFDAGEGHHTAVITTLPARRDAFVDPAHKEAGFFEDLDGVGFDDDGFDDRGPSRGNHRTALTVGAALLATGLIVVGARSTLSPDKPPVERTQATDKSAQPDKNSGIELVAPGTGTPTPTDLPKALAIAPTTPKVPKKATKTTAPPTTTTEAAPRPSTTTEAPVVPIVPVVPSTSAEAPSPSSSPSTTETTTPPSPESPEPADRTIAALKHEVDKTARAEAGDYASKDTLQQILAETGLTRQDILDWQQRYQQTTSDTSTTLENSLDGQSDSPIRNLVHYTDRLQQQAVNTHDGSMFKLAWIDPRTAEERSDQVNSGDYQSYPEADTAEAAGVEKAEVDGQKETFAVVVAEYPTSLGFTERHLSWYIVLAGAEGESRFVLVAKKANQSPYQPPTVDPTPEPTTDPTPTDTPTTDTPADTSTTTENSNSPWYDSNNARRGNNNRPDRSKGGHGNNH